MPAPAMVVPGSMVSVAPLGDVRQVVENVRRSADQVASAVMSPETCSSAASPEAPPAPALPAVPPPPPLPPEVEPALFVPALLVPALPVGEPPLPPVPPAPGALMMVGFVAAAGHGEQRE